MALRVLHIGNIANNAYNIAKVLRERTDIQADSFSHGFLHYISHPEWEDADIDPPRFGEYGPPDWSCVDLRGFERPDWHFLNFDSPARARIASWSAKELLRVVSQTGSQRREAREITELSRSLPESPRRNAKMLRALADLYAGLAADWPRTYTERRWRDQLVRLFRELLAPQRLTPLTGRDVRQYAGEAKRLAELFRRYDIIQTYGVWEPMYPMIATPSIPRVTFEHGSMREHPFHADATGRLLALAYKTSFRNIITNADSIHAIRRLGLDNCTFIPHPVDDGKFRPQESSVRRRLLNEHSCTAILFCPARHNWGIKGNDKVIRAFAHHVHTCGRGPKLFLADWGQEMDRSRKLARDLGVDDSIVWLPPLPKRRLAEMLNASDIVLDQFVLGAFGTTTPEALACARPVILHYKSEDHDWCFDEHPPVVNAFSAEQIAWAIGELLGDESRRRELGLRGREWYLKHHSLDVVVERHVEIYNAIRNSPRVALIAGGAHRQMSVVNARVAAVVRCRVARNPAGEPIYLQQIGDEPIMDILALRLAKMRFVRQVVMVMDEDEPATAAAARKLGWAVVCKEKPRLWSPGVLMALARCTHLALFDLEHPFADAGAFGNLLSEVCEAGLDSAHVKDPACYVPSRIVRKSLAVRAGLFKLIMKGQGVSWKDAFKSVLAHARHAELDPPNGIATLLTAQTATGLTLKALGGADFSLDDLRRFESDRAGQRELLVREMHEPSPSERPHVINAQLNELESKLGLDELESFPTFVGLNMTSVCNARCEFCSYQPHTQKFRDFVTLDDLKNMTWLRYVRELAIWGGIGDSLVNPQFLDCYRYLRREQPHLNITFSTNGIAMDREVCDEFLGHMGSYNVSLNAATRETWEKVMRAKGFDNACESFAYLAQKKRERKLDRPTLALSMVLTRNNIHEAEAFAELAGRLGAETVTYVHYVPSTLVGARDLPAEKSLYFEREQADEMLDKAEAVGRRLGMNVLRPLPFREEGANIHMGTRVGYQPPKCMDPWRTCYLTVDEDGRRQMIFCCSGFYYDIDYDVTNLDTENFRKLWNHPTARYFRRTVHKDNPICRYCMTADRFDPAEKSIYRLAERIEPIFSDLNRKFKEGAMSESNALLERGELASVDIERI